MNFIKHHFLPDSGTFKSILLVAFILTVRICLTKIAANFQEADSPNASPNLAELPNSYFKSTLGERTWQPTTFTVPESNGWNELNVKPTSAELMHGRSVNEEAVAETLLRLQLGPEQVAEPSAPTNTAPTKDTEKSISITFADGICRDDN